MSKLYRYVLPADIDGGGTITIKQLSVEDIYTIDQQVYAAAKTEGDLAAAGARGMREKAIACLAKRNRDDLSGTEREEVYHRLGARGVTLLRAAYRKHHEVDETAVASFLGTLEAD